MYSDTRCDVVVELMKAVQSGYDVVILGGNHGVIRTFAVLTTHIC